MERSMSELGRDTAQRHTTNDLFSRLREETNTLHRELEAQVRIVRPAVNRDDYLQFLIAQRGFHRPFEARFAQIDGLDQKLPDLQRRKKSHLLDLDLRAMGLEHNQVADLPVCDQLPSLSCIDRAVGALYVLEGSTLGATYIQRHLLSVLGESLRGAMRFLNCYGADTGPMWKAFRHHVDEARATLDEDAVVAAACATFAVIKEWFARVDGMHQSARSANAVR